MKIEAVCMQCQFPRNSSKIVKAFPVDYVYLQINDQSVYEYVCPKGHRNALVHQEEKFELLFESAVEAIIDGYLREAVSSVAASLERLFEYSIKVLSIKQNIPKAYFSEAWKNLSKQSERQIGAFLFLYLLEFKKCPPLPSNAQIEFRNSVIHKGYFPTLDETIKYGEGILAIIFEILLHLRENCEDAIQQVAINKTVEMGMRSGEMGLNPTTLSSPTIINLRLARQEFKPVSLKAYIAHRKTKARRII